MVKIRPRKYIILKEQEIEKIVNYEEDSELVQKLKGQKLTAQKLREEWTTNGAYSKINGGNYAFYLASLKTAKLVKEMEEIKEYSRTHPSKIRYKSKTA